MEEFVYDILNKDQWWWEVGRRALVKNLLRRYEIAGPKPRILEIGCGGGALLEDLQHYGSITGIDVGKPALRNCYNRGHNTVVMADGAFLPYPDEMFDVIVAIDVLEHVEDDDAVLREMHRVSRPGATLILTVPAFQILWSRRDIQCHHYRRYTREELRDKVRQRGFRILKSTYINLPLFLPLFMMVKTGQLSSNGKPSIQMDYALVPPPVNKILSQVVKYEARLLKYSNLPIGSSIACVAKRNGNGRITNGVHAD